MESAHREQITKLREELEGKDNSEQVQVITARLGLGNRTYVDLDLGSLTSSKVHEFSY